MHDCIVEGMSAELSLTRVWFSPGLTLLQKLQVHTRFPRSLNPRVTCAQPALLSRKVLLPASRKK